MNVLSTEQKIRLMEVACENIKRYKEMVEAILEKREKPQQGKEE